MESELILVPKIVEGPFLIQLKQCLGDLGGELSGFCQDGVRYADFSYVVKKPDVVILVKGLFIQAEFFPSITVYCATRYE